MQCTTVVDQLCFYCKIHPLEDLAHVGSGSVIKKKKKNEYPFLVKFTACIPLKIAFSLGTQSK